MSTATDTAAPTATTEVTPAVVAPKAPSKKSQADAIFAAKLVDFKAGKFTSNKEFRAAVLRQIETELSVSTASAATMYNMAKKDATTADTEVKLGRDPKKEKVKGTGKRGRPVGSGKKVAEVEVPAVAEPVAEAAEAVA